MLQSILTALLLSFDFETGYVPRAASSEYMTPQEIRYKASDNVFMLSLKPSFEWKFLYGNIEVSTFSASPKNGKTFVPFRGSFQNEIGLFYKSNSFKATLGWTHNCQHQIITATYYDYEKRWKDIGYDKVFLRVSFSNKP